MLPTCHTSIRGWRLSNHHRYHLANLGSVAKDALLVGVHQAYMCIVLLSFQRSPGIRLLHQFRIRGDNSVQIH
jgi:hypothetical protein